MYIQGIIVGVLLACGQSLWKGAAESGNFSLSRDFLFSGKILAFVLSPRLILGTLIYVAATLVYLAMLARYSYSNVQGMVVTASLISAFLIAGLMFREHFTWVNLAGMGLLLAGVFLLTRR